VVGPDGEDVQLTDAAFAQLFVSTNLEAEGLAGELVDGVPNPFDPTSHWIKIFDNKLHDTDNDEPFRQDLFRWDKDERLLSFDWKLPRNNNDPRFSDAPEGFSIIGDWYLRVVLFDGSVDADGNPNVPPGTGIAGEEDNPDENFLVDGVEPFIADPTLRAEVTNVLTIVRSTGGSQPPAPPVADAEIDALIDSIALFEDLGEINKSAAKQLTFILNNAKELSFEPLNDPNSPGCLEMTNFVDTLAGLKSNKITTPTRDSLDTEADLIIAARCVVVP